MTARGPAVVAALVLQGCACRWGGADGDWDWDDDWTFGDTFDEGVDLASEPPDLRVSLDAQRLPLGPHDAIRMACTAEAGLDLLAVSFRGLHMSDLGGATSRVERVRAHDLGEGLGTLTATLTDVRGGRTEVRIDGVLIDLTPPEVLLGDLRLAVADAEAPEALELVVADGWILGGVEIDVAGVKLTKTFPDAWPATVGSDWDVSLVRFPTHDLPPGVHVATVWIWDAAFNLHEEGFELVVDAVPPTVAVLAPESGAVLEGPFLVEVLAEDDHDGPVTVEVRVGEVVAGTLLGPEASVALEALDFLPGATEVVVVAVDAAGNRSEAVRVPVEVL